MNINPIYKRESRISARSLRLPLILVAFNSILALVALLNMYSTLAQVRQTAEIQYTSFLDLYVFVAILEFVMLLLIMPAITAGSISGERERQTLELMLATKMTPAQVVFGKFAVAGSTMLLQIVSSFPILAMVFVYGGITRNDMLMLLLCFITITVFLGSIGLCCSAFAKKATAATIAAYVIEAVLIGGTYVVDPLVTSISRLYAANTAGIAPVQGDPAQYLLLLNPSLNFLKIIRGTAGTGQTGAELMFVQFSGQPAHVAADNWMVMGFVVQWLAAFFLILLAVYRTDPRCGKR